MILARMENGDFVIGLDAENVKRLQAGQPIQVRLDRHGGHGKVLITYGETLADIVADLSEASGQDLAAMAQPSKDLQ